MLPRSAEKAGHDLVGRLGKIERLAELVGLQSFESLELGVHQRHLRVVAGPAGDQQGDGFPGPQQGEGSKVVQRHGAAARRDSGASAPNKQ